MTNADFNPLYKDRTLRRKLFEMCRNLFNSNRAAWEHGASGGLGPVFEAEELEQECWIHITAQKPGQENNFYLKTVKNYLLEKLRVAKRRAKIATRADVETVVICPRGIAGEYIPLAVQIWGDNPDFPGEKGAKKRAKE